jgi:hypothetical protein
LPRRNLETGLARHLCCPCRPPRSCPCTTSSLSDRSRLQCTALCRALQQASAKAVWAGPHASHAVAVASCLSGQRFGKLFDNVTVPAFFSFPKFEICLLAQRDRTPQRYGRSRVRQSSTLRVRRDDRGCLPRDVMGRTVRDPLHVSCHVLRS